MVRLSTTVKFTPDLRAIGRLNDQSGPVGRSTRNAAETTKKRFQNSVNAYGRVDTGRSRDQASVTFRGSNQHGVQFAVSAGSDYWRFQEFGTIYITPAPALQNALRQLRPEDFKP